jgi:hypothetical protein
MKQTLLQEVRDLIREDDKLRGPNQKSVESCKRRSYAQFREKLTTWTYMQKGEHPGSKGTDIEQRRPRAGPGWEPFAPTFALAAIQAIYSPLTESYA